MDELFGTGSIPTSTSGSCDPGSSTRPCGDRDDGASVRVALDFDAEVEVADARCLPAPRSNHRMRGPQPFAFRGRAALLGGDAGPGSAVVVGGEMSPCLA